MRQFSGMKLWLLASCLLNVALGCYAGYLLIRKSPISSYTKIQEKPSAAPEVKIPDTPKPFHWSQIESPDFATYVANLRSIGCPEATIRDIVAAEMKEIFDEKRRALAERNHLGASRQTIDKEYQKLAQEEHAIVARMVSDSSVASSRSASSTTGTASPYLAGAMRQRTENPSWPIVFQGLVSGIGPQTNGAYGISANSRAGQASALSPAQTEVVRDLQQQFVQDIGGPNQNPADPVYLKKWQAAQKDSNDSLRAQLGWAAFEDYLSQAAGQSSNN
jgi:hypothetical protein